MANFGQLILTNLGIQEQYNAQGGTPLKFKRIGMGSGRFSGNASTLTKLVTENVSVDISKGYMQNGHYVVEGFFSNIGLETSFEWREIGLFVEDANGKEILYCYANAGETYDYIPATEDERYSKYIRIATAIGNATEVTFKNSEEFVCVDLQTFNELSEEVDSLYPSKELSGSTILIEDSAELPFIGMNIYGKSMQEKTTGKNLIDLSELEFDDSEYIHAHVYSSSDTANALWNFLQNNIGKTIVYSADIKGDTTGVTVGQIRFYDSNNTLLYLLEPNVPLTIPEATSEFTQCYIYGSTSGASVKNIQIEYGNAATEYEVYTGGIASPNLDYPQEITSVAQNGNVKVDVHGRNLWTSTERTGNLSYDPDTEIYTISGHASQSVYELPIPIPAGTHCSISVDIISGNITNTEGKDGAKFGGYNNAQADSTWQCSVNLPAGTNLDLAGRRLEYSGVIDKPVTDFWIFMYSGYLTINEPITCKIQFEISEEAHEYESYKRQSLIVSTPDGLPGIPVESGGNYTDSTSQQWLCDEVDLEKGVYIQRITAVTLDGSDALIYYKNSNVEKDNNYLYYVGVKHTIAHGLCDKLTAKNVNILNRANGNGPENLGFSTGNHGSAMYFNIGYYMTENTLAEAKRILSENPITITYARHTVSEIPLTDEEIELYKSLRTNNPATTILNDVGAWMSPEYVTKSHNGVIGDIHKRLSNYLPLSGGTIQGRLYVNANNYEHITLKSKSGYNNYCSCADERIRIETRNGVDPNNLRRIELMNALGSEMKTALHMADVVNGTIKYYQIFGEHNKPTGSYTGNGSTTSRKIEIAGIGSLLYVYGNGSVMLVTSHGAFGMLYSATSMKVVKQSEANFSNGVLTLATTNDALNSNGATYNYRVI